MQNFSILTFKPCHQQTFSRNTVLAKVLKGSEWERGRELKLCVSAGLKLYLGRVIILERSIALYYFYRSEALLLFTSCNAVHYSDWALIKFRVEDNKRKLFYILEPTKKNYISFLKLMFTTLRTTCCCCYEVAWGPSSCLSVNTYLVGINLCALIVTCGRASFYLNGILMSQDCLHDCLSLRVSVMPWLWWKTDTHVSITDRFPKDDQDVSITNRRPHKFYPFFVCSVCLSTTPVDREEQEGRGRVA